MSETRVAKYAKAMHASTCDATREPPCPVDGNLAWEWWAEAAVAVADTELAELREHPVVTTSQISTMHAYLVEQIGHGIDPAIVRKAVEHAGLTWDFHAALVNKA